MALYGKKSVDDGEMDPKKHTSSVKSCLQRVDGAMKWRKNAGYDEKWAKIIKLYGNQYDYSELQGYSDIIAPNMMFSTANVIVPSVMVNYPKVTVNARKPEDVVSAAIVEDMTNYYWSHFDFHEEIKLATRDFVMMGMGVAKVTWLLEESEGEVPRDEWVEQAKQAIFDSQMAQMQAQQLGMPFEPMDEEEILGSVPTTRTIVVEDRPHVERVSPFDVYIDPDATRIKNARWVAQRMYVPLEEARDNDVWNAKARKKLQGTAMSQAKKDYDLTFEGEERGKDSDFVVVWEYYDLITGKMCVFADGCDEFLIEPTEFPYPFGHPFVFMLNHIIPEKLYPMGDLEALVPLQMELAMTRTQMVNDRKRYRRMYMYKPDQIGPDGLAALMSADDNAMIPVDSDSPFGEVIAPIATTALPPEFYSQTAMILDDMDRTSAVTEYQRGSVAEVRRTATEAAMIQDMSNARSADKLASVERAISEIAERCVQLAQEFLTTEQIAAVVGPDGAAGWREFDRDSIQGQFDFMVEAGSTQPQNESFRRQSAMQLLDAMAPFIQAGVVDAAKLAEHVLRNGFGIKDTSAFMAPPQPMMPPEGMPPEGMPPQGLPQGMPQGMPPEMMGGMPPQM